MALFAVQQSGSSRAPRIGGGQSGLFAIVSTHALAPSCNQSATPGTSNKVVSSQCSTGIRCGRRRLTDGTTRENATLGGPSSILSSSKTREIRRRNAPSLSLAPTAAAPRRRVLRRCRFARYATALGASTSTTRIRTSCVRASPRRRTQGSVRARVLPNVTKHAAACVHLTLMDTRGRRSEFLHPTHSNGDSHAADEMREKGGWDMTGTGEAYAADKGAVSLAMDSLSTTEAINACRPRASRC